MNNLISKLQSKRGVSIMLALLLFLVCLLAGVAALTAASANVGRHNYMHKTQQQYLAVSSAAKLIREQLDGMEIKCEYTFVVDDTDGEGYEKPSATNPGFKIKEGKGIFTDGTAGISYASEDNIIRFFEDALKLMNYDAFCKAVQGEPGGVPWNPTPRSLDMMKTKYSYTVTCEAIRYENAEGEDAAMPIAVEVVIDYPNQVFTVEVSFDRYILSTSGKIIIVAETPKVNSIEEFFEYPDPDAEEGSGAMIGGFYTKVTDSSQTTTITFELEDSFELITPDDGEEGDETP